MEGRWNNADEILRAMDARQFAQQRATLIRIVEHANEHQIGPCEEGDLDGLLNLLDELADHAHDALGLDCLIVAGEEKAELPHLEDVIDPRD